MDTEKKEIEEKLESVEKTAEPKKAKKASPKKSEETKKGIVVNCRLLNVRKDGVKGSAVLEMIPEGSKVSVKTEKSNELFYQVTTEKGIVGFCMKQYIALT